MTFLKQHGRLIWNQSQSVSIKINYNDVLIPFLNGIGLNEYIDHFNILFLRELGIKNSTLPAVSAVLVRLCADV